MDQAIKAKWVEALRSGKYEQGQHALRQRNNAFCCLGVLGDVVAPDQWSLETDGYYFGSRHCSLPTVFRARCGLGMEEAEALAGMNDSGDSFAEIADHIEANL